MPDYTVRVVRDSVRDWQSGRGQEMKSYRLDVDGPGEHTENVELAQLATTAPPKVGDVIAGTIEERKYGENQSRTDYKLQKERKGGGGGGGGPRSYIEIEHPSIYAARQAAIIRQSQHTAAIQLLQVRGELDGPLDDVMEKIGTAAGLLHADVNKAAGEAFARRGETCPMCGATHEGK